MLTYVPVLSQRQVKMLCYAIVPRVITYTLVMGRLQER